MQHNKRFLNIVNDAKTRIQEITITIVKSYLDTQKEFFLIDAREDNEWRNSHLPKAIHLSKGMLECKIEQLVNDPQAEIVVYCGGGYRSSLAVDNLQKMGYQNVKSMAGGFRAWQEANYPVV